MGLDQNRRNCKDKEGREIERDKTSEPPTRRVKWWGLEKQPSSLLQIPKSPPRETLGWGRDEPCACSCSCSAIAAAENRKGESERRQGDGHPIIASLERQTRERANRCPNAICIAHIILLLHILGRERDRETVRERERVCAGPTQETTSRSSAHPEISWQSKAISITLNNRIIRFFLNFML